MRPALLGNLRGRNYDVFYLGYNADGRIGRINLTASSLCRAMARTAIQHLHQPPGEHKVVLLRRGELSLRP